MSGFGLPDIGLVTGSGMAPPSQVGRSPRALSELAGLTNWQATGDVYLVRPE